MASRLVFYAVLVAAAAPGCGLLLDYDPPTDAARPDVPGPDAPMADVPIDAPPVDGSPDVPLDALPDVPRDTLPDARLTECIADADCMGLPTPPCASGEWRCFLPGTCGIVCPDCTDADHDGYGVGLGCAGGDCDDADRLVLDAMSAACYPGSPASAGVGACHEGIQECVDGTWGPCLGAVTPLPEVCNGVDDDCDGASDDGTPSVVCGIGTCATRVSVCSGGSISACPPTAITPNDGCGGGDMDCDGIVDEDCGPCVWVLPSGNDGSTNPTAPSQPMRTVQAAIDWAADPMNAAPPRVCLMATACGTNTVFSGDVTMRDGISVIGNWSIGGATQCGSLSTTLAPASGAGVRFDGSITRGATLSDVRVRPATASRSVGITVTGATGAVVSGVEVTAATGTVSDGYGIDVVSGGDALITRSSVTAGNATREAIGVRVVGARARLVENCAGGLDGSGRCATSCPFGVGSNGIRGRADTGTSRAMVSHAVLFSNAGGSVLTQSSLCGQKGDTASGLHIDGDATGVVVMGNHIGGWGGVLTSFGVDLVDCGDASPWIVGNTEISGEGSATTPNGAIRSRGACHPVISGNLRLVGGLEGRGLAHGVICEGGSRCIVVDNPRIEGSPSGFPTTSIGVLCDTGGCALVARNGIDGRGGVDTVGLALGAGAPRVERNRITGGCPSTRATGIRAIDSGARLENNVVSAIGPSCAASAGGGLVFVALAVEASAASVLDVRSNDLFGGGLGGLSCTSRGVVLTGRGARVGLFRGNIIDGGLCPTAHGVLEVDAASDPIGFFANDVVRTTFPLYRDEGTTDLANVSAIEALGDVPAVGNIDLLPAFVSATDFHLLAGSPCIDADHAPIPPLVDFDGRARTGVPDIGAYER